MIEFTYPDNMKNGQLEQLLIAIEESLENRSFGPFVPEVIQEAIEEHGERAIHEMIGSYIISWCEICFQEEPPDGKYYKERAREHLHLLDKDAALKELADYRRNSQRYLGKVVTRCLGCGRMRHGLEWQDKPTPDGWCEIFTECPECEQPKASSYQEPVEYTDDDLKAWLTEGDLVPR